MARRQRRRRESRPRERKPRKPAPELEKIDDYRWRIPKEHDPDMRVDGIVYANETLLKEVKSDQSLRQVANVAHLPGIIKYSLAMPDMHEGYGFPIGGVAAMDPENEGVVSPGGIGYDINCGVRLLRTNLRDEDVAGKTKELIDRLFAKVPCGVGSKGVIRLSHSEEKEALAKGSAWAVENGYGKPEDLEYTEENGRMELADPNVVSQRALERGKNQLGTLGSGNHFLEIQVVDRIFNQSLADVLGLEVGQITVMIHTGSRGFGHQVCDEYVKTWAPVTEKYNIVLPDRQLVCAPINSPEGKQYIAAMACAANFAWANRQCIMHWTREVFSEFFGMSQSELGLELIYDVAHNIGKFEEHRINGETRTVFIHRKGATRAFPPGHPDVPAKYRDIGQPVIIPGDMGTASHVLVGTQLAMDETWASTCHGAGRVMSRSAAIRATKGRALQREMEDQGIFVRYEGRTTLQEETPEAYKDVDEVVKVVDEAGISKRVARMRPLGVIKG